MKVAYRGTLPRLRSGFSFAVSGCVHGCVLAWVVLGGGGPPQPRAQSIYDQEIRPNEKQIVWYSLREKLPEIAPAETKPDARPARARVKAPQTMVAGARDDAQARYIDLGAGAGDGGAESGAAAECGGGGAAEGGAAIRGAAGEAPRGGEGRDAGGGSGGGGESARLRSRR